MHEQNIAKIQDQRQKRMNQKKEDSFRRGVETKLRSVAENLENLEKEFPELSEAQRSTILTVMSDSSSLNGLYFEHVWYVNEHNVLYNGHIIFVKPLTKSKIPNSCHIMLQLQHMGSSRLYCW